MNYIVNPIWFYWVQISSGAREASCAVAIILTISTIVSLIIWSISKSLCKEFPNISDGERNRCLGLERLFKPAIIGLIISWGLYILLPSKETLISMLIAKYASYENAQWTLETVKSAVDYIVQAIQSIK